MAWITPKTDWTTADGVDYTDLNRIEGNLVALQTGTKEHVLLTATGTAILARDGGVVHIGSGASDAGAQVVIQGIGEEGVVTDAGSHGGSIFVRANGTGAGSGGAIHFGTTFGNSDSIGFASIKGYVTDGGDNTKGYLDTFIRKVETDTFLTFAERLTPAGNRLIGTTSDPGETLHVNGSARFTGSFSSIAIDQDGNQLKFLSTSNSQIAMPNVGGYLRIITNGRGLSDSTANLIFNADQSVTVNTTLLVDTISEKTAGAGVTIDGVLLKDNKVSTDTIIEKTAGAGITIDGVLLKDTSVSTDAIFEKTAGHGVPIDGVLLKDNTVTADTLTSTTSIVPSSASVLGSWALTTTPILIPRGIYSIVHFIGTAPNQSVIQFYDGSIWISYSVSSPQYLSDLIFSDGVNYRILMAAGTGTAKYRKF